MERRQVLTDVLADPWPAEPGWSTTDLSDARNQYEALEGTVASAAIGFMEASCAEWYVLYEAAVVWRSCTYSSSRRWTTSTTLLCGT
ncbi:hypothetical protein [Streptomyces sp. NPDC058295]|uniref:hypothetical protein n=1 Tax=Streptomyces sp. NPDC058295 TaxID=3346431 RepID=UPI0036ECCEF8